MKTELALREATTSSVEELVPPSSIELLPQPVYINPAFDEIMLTLYEAFQEKKGWYKTATVESMAPQWKWYPGSPAFRKALEKAEEKNRKQLEGIEGFKIPSSTEAQALFVEANQELDTPAKAKHLEKVRALLRVAKRLEAKESQNYDPGKTVERGTKEWERWGWFSVLTDRREKSDRVYEAHCWMYRDHPELYDKRIASISVEEFHGMIQKGRYKIGSPYDSAEYWIRCGKTLFEEFDGDPVKLLEHAGWSVESVYRWKKQEKKKRGYDPIPGWGRKLISLYFLYLAELGYLMPIDAYPADVHAQAFVIQTGMLEYQDRDVVYSNEVAELVRKRITELCIRETLKPADMAHASWLKGQMCQKCSSIPNARELCAIYDKCRGRVDTSHYFAKGRWPKEIQIMAKGGERPAYGVPTDFDPRKRTAKKGLTQRELANIQPLFPRQQKVIPIISLVE